MREQQAEEDKRAGEPADDHVHFHIDVILVCLMETGRNQHAEHRAVYRADDGMAGKRAGTGGTAHKFIPSKAETAASNDPNDNA